MEGNTQRGRVGPALVLLATAFSTYRTDTFPESVPAPTETLQTVGRRLSQSNSESELCALASHGKALLRLLRPGERAALARGYVRFKAEVPVVVDVAAPAMSIPFWIGDDGFVATELELKNADTSWKVFRKRFGAGWIGLGVNGLDRAPVAHYVVFISPAFGQEECSPGHKSLLALDARDERSWKATRARPGVSAAHDVYRPFHKLPAYFDGALVLQPSHARRHSALLATGRVWKTHLVASRLPDQVTISFGSDPARELVWTWRTSIDIATTGLRLTPARAGAEPRSPDAQLQMRQQAVRVVGGEASRVEVDNLLNDPAILRHHAVVRGLKPDTTYRYSLGDGTSEGWGPWQLVKTAPDRSRGVRFLYLGDPQTGLERWGRLLAAAYRRHPRIDFIVIGGDLVDRGNERTNWDHFFLRAAGVFDRVPLLPCAGNHEYLDMGPRLYRAFFELPHNGPEGIDADLVYRFECGDAVFAVLDSTLAVSDPDLAQRQAGWLDQELGRSKASWKFVIFHHPVYPSHPWRDTPVLRAAWVPIFDKHHVDFVFQGHDHAYLRTYPLHAHKRVREPSEGTIYVIAVSGDKFVSQPRRDYIAVGRTGLPTYQTIEIDSDSQRLAYRAWSEDGSLVDEVCIQKPRADRCGRFSAISSGAMRVPGAILCGSP
jgi:hypothetical protein